MLLVFWSLVRRGSVVLTPGSLQTMRCLFCWAASMLSHPGGKGSACGWEPCWWLSLYLQHVSPVFLPWEPVPKQSLTSGVRFSTRVQVVDSHWISPRGITPVWVSGIYFQRCWSSCPSTIQLASPAPGRGGQHSRTTWHHPGSLARNSSSASKQSKGGCVSPRGKIPWIAYAKERAL